MKIRGFRVELGEIESVLARHPLVDRAVVTVREDRPGDKRLVAYVTAADGTAPDPGKLRAHAAAIMPGYLVPSAFVLVEDFPRLPTENSTETPSHHRNTPRGRSTTAGTSVIPRGSAVRTVRQVLGVPRAGADDNFFDLGGHSLLAVRLISRIKSVMKADLDVRELFEAPTASGLAGLLDARTAGSDTEPLKPVARPEGRPLPLSYAQGRLWILDRMHGPSAAYNIPMAWRLSGTVDAGALRQALSDVAARHESLRTIFPDSDGVPSQLILDSTEAHPVLEVAKAGDELPQAIARACGHTFDLSAELPLRAWLFGLPDTDHVLVLVVHHIAADGWSMTPLLNDLSAAYAARCRGNPPSWEDLPVQYADYTLWQRRLLETAELKRQVEFWRLTLAGLTPLGLPAVRSRPAGSGRPAGHARLSIESPLHGRLLALAREHDATLFMVLHASLAALLWQAGSGTDVPVGTPVAGRTDEALDGLVGFFVNTLVLRVEVSPGATFREFLRRVRTADLAAFAHQEVPFERVVAAVNPKRAVSDNPLFQVMLNLEPEQVTSLDLHGIRAVAEDTVLPSAKFDAAFVFREAYGGAGEPAGMDLTIEYAADVIDRGVAEELAGRLVRLLGVVAADPGVRVGELEVVSEAERERILGEWNDTGVAVEERTLPSFVEEQAGCSPGAVAVVCGERELSYAELDRRANRLARYLVSRGAGPERVVALALPRGELMVVALLAVMKAGAAYLPVDPDYPAARIAFMLADAGPALLVSDSETAGGLPAGDFPVVVLDRGDVSSRVAACRMGR